MKLGRLYLVPSTLGPGAPLGTVPAVTLARLETLDYLIVETPKQARRFLQQCGIRLGARQIRFGVLDEHTADADLPELLSPVTSGIDAGVLSDAGCPAVADPGARLVSLAHRLGIEVAPLVGPSSIMLALMASGLNGQCFAFRGYLPVDAHARVDAIRAYEQFARERDETQIFIEAPYRNNQLAKALVQACALDTRLCIAADLTLPTQFVRTGNVGDWRGGLPDLHRRPTVFLLGRPRR